MEQISKEVLQQLLEYLRQGVGFVSTQAPLVAQEYIFYQRVCYTCRVVLLLAIVYVCWRIAKVGLDKMGELKGLKAEYEKISSQCGDNLAYNAPVWSLRSELSGRIDKSVGEIPGWIAGGAAPGLLFTIILFIVGGEGLKFYIAPRLCVLEWLAGLVK